MDELLNNYSKSKTYLNTFIVDKIMEKIKRKFESEIEKQQMLEEIKTNISNNNDLVNVILESPTSLFEAFDNKNIYISTICTDGNYRTEISFKDKVIKSDNYSVRLTANIKGIELALETLENLL